MGFRMRGGSEALSVCSRTWDSDSDFGLSDEQLVRLGDQRRSTNSPAYESYRMRGVTGISEYTACGGRSDSDFGISDEQLAEINAKRWTVGGDDEVSPRRQGFSDLALPQVAQSFCGAQPSQPFRHLGLGPGLGLRKEEKGRAWREHVSKIRKMTTLEEFLGVPPAPLTSLEDFIGS